MTELVLLKLGGSLITDKRTERAFRADVMTRIAREIAEVRLSGGPSLVLGHGSGSFGHFAARRFGTAAGVSDEAAWAGFAVVAAAAADLNQRVVDALLNESLPALRLQPSAMMQCTAGEVSAMHLEPLKTALSHGLLPVVYGDVAFDAVRGGTIASTERVFFHIAKHLPVSRVLLAGEVPGVLNADGNVISRITPANFAGIEAALGGSGGVDVTGGMETKVRDMLALAQAMPGLMIQIIDGRQPGLIADALAGDRSLGTAIVASDEV